MQGVDVVLGMTLSKTNVDHFPVAFEAAKRVVPDLRPDEFHVNIVHESPHYLGNTDLGLKRTSIARGSPTRSRTTPSGAASRSAPWAISSARICRASAASSRPGARRCAATR
jgi:hypothetical protein